MAKMKLKKVIKKQLPKRRDILMVALGAFIVLIIIGVIMLIRDSKTPLGPQSKTITAAWIPSTVKHWQQPIDEMAQRYDIDPNFLAIIMTMESGGYAQANSGEAQGLMQITPATAKDIASKYIKHPVTKYDLYNPDTSIEFGAAYLAWLRDQFGATNQAPSWDMTAELVAAAYNGGPSAALSLEQGQGLTNTQTVVYSRDAYNMWRERVAKDSPTFDRWEERGGSQLIQAAQTAHQ